MMRARTSRMIGIDVGSQTIKAAQWGEDPDARPNTVSVSRSSSGPTPTRQEIEHLACAVARQGFVGRRAVLAIPDSLVKTTMLSLPPRSSGAPLDTLAYTEMEETLGYGTPFTLVTWDLPQRTTSGNSTDVSVVACTRADLDPLVEVITAAGFDVEAADVAHCAIARLIEPRVADPNDLTICVDIGYSSTRAALVLGGDVVYHRKITTGGLNALHDEIATRFHIEPDVVPYLTSAFPELPDSSSITADVRQIVGAFLTAISRDLETAISYGLNSYRDAHPKRLCVVGGGGDICDVGAFLGEMLGMPPAADPLPSSHPPSRYVAAAAVARREMERAA